jgi:hypothetical protein
MVRLAHHDQVREAAPLIICHHRVIKGAARLQRRAALAAEVAALEADEDDRREMLEVAALMEIMRAAG